MNAGGAIDVVIVNWNGRRWLPRCLEALARSTVPVHIILVDNASTDGSAEYVRTAHATVQVMELGSNRGYAAGANAGLLAGNAPYAFVMNPDVLLAPDHLEQLRACLETHATTGIAQGKLYRLTPDEFDAGALPTHTIDSTGHVIRRSRMVVDRGQGQPDAPEYDFEAQIFSACGAALFLRRRMLHDVAPDGEYFPESFFAYKEDIDLGWRARLLGWDVRYVPRAIAHHVRSLPLGGNAWRAMPVFARRHSWKNHYLLMLRNDRMRDMLRALPFLAGWEVARIGHALLRDPRVLTVYRELAREAGAALRARREILRRRRSTPEQIRRWFGSQPVADG